MSSKTSLVPSTWNLIDSKSVASTGRSITSLVQTELWAQTGNVSTPQGNNYWRKMRMEMDKYQKLCESMHMASKHRNSWGMMYHHICRLRIFIRMLRCHRSRSTLRMVNVRVRIIKSQKWWNKFKLKSQTNNCHSILENRQIKTRISRHLCRNRRMMKIIARQRLHMEMNQITINKSQKIRTQ